jgi:hypothetical protein
MSVPAKKSDQDAVPVWSAVREIGEPLAKDLTDRAIVFLTRLKRACAGRPARHPSSEVLMAAASDMATVVHAGDAMNLHAWRHDLVPLGRVLANLGSQLHMCWRGERRPSSGMCGAAQATPGSLLFLLS